MSVRELDTSKDTAAVESEQEQAAETRPVPVLQAKFDPVSRQEVIDALALFGFDSTAEGMRLILKAFSRSPVVRDAVRHSLHLAVLDVPEQQSA